MFYRFKNGIFVEAENFNGAKQKLVAQIMSETEDEKRWHSCTCLGFQHKFDCPNNVMCY